ncbi:hypothetical protein V8F20_005613 [Naviculisporaceae sp. PSN 640]
MHLQFSVVLAVTLGAFTQAVPNFVNARQGGDVVFGPSQICLGLSRGGSDSCFIVPEGCFVDRPTDNAIPTPVCQDGSKQTLIPVPAPAPTRPPAPNLRLSLLPKTPIFFPVSSSASQGAPEDIVFGGNSLCFGLSHGSGDSCFLVFDGCIATKPTDITIPTPICADGSQQSLIPIPSPAATPQTPGQPDATAPVGGPE